MPRRRVLIRVVLVAVVPLALAGCGPGSSTGDVPAATATLDLTGFAHDTPAIGTGWYDYDASTHALSPKAERYVLRDDGEGASRFAAFRVVSYYDPAIAASGRFTLAVSTWDGGGWSAEEEWLTSRDVKQGGPLCLDVFTTSERACEGAGWQVQLRAIPFLVLEGPLVIKNPGILVNSDGGAVRVAALPGSSLAGLPAPASLEELDDAPPTGWQTPAWARERLAPHLPVAGMVLGPRFVEEGHTARDDVFFLLGPSRHLVRLAFRPEEEGDPEAGVIVASSAAPVDFTSLEVPALPEGEERTFQAAEGEVWFLRFTKDEEPVVAGSPFGLEALVTPPAEDTWDLALYRAEGELRFSLSPAAALLNHTAAGGEDASAFADAAPPTTEEP